MSFGGDEFATTTEVEGADETTPAEEAAPTLTWQLEVVGEYPDDSEQTRYEREDQLARDLREFLKGRGVSTAVLVTSRESVDLAGEPHRDGV